MPAGSGIVLLNCKEQQQKVLCISKLLKETENLKLL